MSSSSLAQLALKVLDAQLPWATGTAFKTSSPESQVRKQALLDFSNQLEQALAIGQVKSQFGSFRCDYSKGMGVDTSSPWVRIFNDRNPKPTIGWSTVIFGAEDGNSIAIAASQGIYGGGLNAGRKISKRVIEDTSYPAEYKSPMNIGLNSKATQYQSVSPLSYRIDRAELQALNDEAFVERVNEFLLLTEKVAIDYPVEIQDSWAAKQEFQDHWLFQFNDKYWDFERFVMEGNRKFVFKIGNYKDRVKVGDKFAMWKSGPKAGLVAFGSVVAAPEDIPVNDITNAYYFKPLSRDEIDTRVEIEVEEILSDSILKQDLAEGLSQNNIFKAPQSTSPFLLSKFEYEYLRQKAGFTVMAQEQIPELTTLSKETFLPAAWLSDVIEVLGNKRQVILQGPPGTGKTFLARELARFLAPKENVRLVQFHPSYAYEDFIQGYRPVSKEIGLTFEVKDGVLVELARKAQENPTQNFILIIDEINRGNLAKVFGELYFLLEYRDEEVILQYGNSKDQFRLPSNLQIIGTMNTADRSIASLDAAIRRRFAFIDLKPDVKPVGDVLSLWLAENSLPTYINDIHVYVNERITDSRFKLGPSYFMKNDIVKTLDYVWNYEVMPQLNEIFFEDQSQLEEFELRRVLKDLGIDR
jgi:hypothetical protein